MAIRNLKKTMAVDKNFFENIFEPERKKLQKQLGLNNLSQPDFSKMIEGLKIKAPKKIENKFKIKRGGKNNDFFKI